MCRNCVKNDDFVENGYFQEKFYLETLGLLEKDFKGDFVVVIVPKLCGKYAENDDFVENVYFPEKFHLETLRLLEKDF